MGPITHKTHNFVWVLWEYSTILFSSCSKRDSEFFWPQVKWFLEFYFTTKFWSFKLKMPFRLLGVQKKVTRHFFALISRQKKHEAWKGFASYRICGASYFAAMPQNASYAERRASPNQDPPFQMKQLRYEAFSVSLQIWRIRFAHMMRKWKMKVSACNTSPQIVY